MNIIRYFIICRKDKLTQRSETDSFLKTHSISVYSGRKLQQIAPAGLQGYISASLPTNSKLQSYCQYTSKTIKEGFPNILERWKTTYHVKKKTTHL